MGTSKELLCNPLRVWQICDREQEMCSSGDCVNLFGSKGNGGVYHAHQVVTRQKVSWNPKQQLLLLLSEPGSHRHSKATWLNLQLWLLINTQWASQCWQVAPCSYLLSFWGTVFSSLQESWSGNILSKWKWSPEHNLTTELATPPILWDYRTKKITASVQSLNNSPKF